MNVPVPRAPSPRLARGRGSGGGHNDEVPPRRESRPAGRAPAGGIAQAVSLWCTPTVRAAITGPPARRPPRKQDWGSAMRRRRACFSRSAKSRAARPGQRPEAERYVDRQDGGDVLELSTQGEAADAQPGDELRQRGCELLDREPVGSGKDGPLPWPGLHPDAEAEVEGDQRPAGRGGLRSGERSWGVLSAGRRWPARTPTPRERVKGLLFWFAAGRKVRAERAPLTRDRARRPSLRRPPKARRRALVNSAQAPSSRR